MNFYYMNICAHVFTLSGGQRNVEFSWNGRRFAALSLNSKMRASLILYRFPFYTTIFIF